MADRYTGTLTILKSDIERYPELKEAIKNQFYTADGQLYNPDTWNEDSILANFCDYEARYGHFEEIEHLCRELHIPYNQWSESYYASEGPLTRYYRPDIDDKEIYADGNGEQVFTENKLKDIAKKAKERSRTGLHEEYLLHLGIEFDTFLKQIPDIKSLEKYEGYIHKEKYTVIFPDASFPTEFTAEHAKKATEMAIEKATKIIKPTGITLYLPSGLKVYKSKEYNNCQDNTKPVYVIEKAITIN